MIAKELKDWVNSLPDDALVHVLSSRFHSIPILDPCFIAIDDKTIKTEIGGFISGKVLSSFPKD